ncbi:hypothetical protein QP177_07080 [Gardnerella vaginalis]|uniref:Uncharacterized protein n=1 Tax=Gardnerella vaginalis TaxID=2702 RepID=A0ABD4ZF58_GARVA|nr:hypothetical protein [Gardnerella vaginalis]MDK6696311.1 hypothetical protein [Gardnerella vaginalis]
MARIKRVVTMSLNAVFARKTRLTNKPCKAIKPMALVQGLSTRKQAF